MKKYEEIAKYKVALEDVVTEIYDRGYDRGYSSKYTDEIKRDTEAVFNHALEELRDALLDKDFLKANYGCTKIRDILIDFNPRGIVEEYYDYVNRVDEDEDDDPEDKPKVCSLVGFVCPYDADCKNCEVYKAVEKALETGGKK